MHRPKDKKTALIEAAWNGHAEIADLLVKAGAKIDVRNYDGRTPLHLASKYGHPAIVKLLLEAGADPNVKDTGGSTPLTFAVEGDYLKIAQALLKAGADVNLHGALHKSPVVIAIQDRKEQLVKFFETQKLDTPSRLLCAVYDGDVEKVKRLFAAGVDPNDKHGLAPLRLAVSKGHEELVRILIAAGTEVNSEDRSPFQFTLLIEASQRGQDQIVRILLDSGADANAQDEEGFTALMWAVMGEHRKTVQLLLKRDAEPDVTIPLANTGGNGETALVFAAYKSDIDMIELLLNAGADINAGGALAEAASHGKMAPAELLVARGADVNWRNPRNRRSVLRDAAESGHVRIAKFLIENHASVDLADRLGCTPLMAAALNGHLDVVQLLVNGGNRKSRTSSRKPEQRRSLHSNNRRSPGDALEPSSCRERFVCN